MGIRLIAVVLVWTWTFWAIPVVLPGSPWNTPSVIFLYIGGAGPLVIGLVFAMAESGGPGLGDLGLRLIDPRRIKAVWWLAVLALVPAIEAAASFVATLVNEGQLAKVLGPLWGSLGDPAGFIATAGFVLLLGPLPEEIGWRGVSLDALQQRFSPLVASLVLAAAWAAWHAPLFLMDGYYERFGEAPNPLHFTYDNFLTTLLITWI